MTNSSFGLGISEKIFTYFLLNLLRSDYKKYSGSVISKHPGNFAQKTNQNDKGTILHTLGDKINFA